MGCESKAPFSGFKGAEKKSSGTLFTQGFAWACGSMTGGIVRRYVTLRPGFWRGLE